MRADVREFLQLSMDRAIRHELETDETMLMRSELADYSVSSDAY